MAYLPDMRRGARGARPASAGKGRGALGCAGNPDCKGCKGCGAMHGTPHQQEQQQIARNVYREVRTLMDQARARGGGMMGFGDDADDTSATKMLQVQLNRFTKPIPGDKAPLYATPLAVTGTLDSGTAVRAVTIIARRGILALAKIPDAGTQQIVQDAVVAISNPVPFVQKDIAGVAQTVKIFADLSGLPAASPLAMMDPRVLKIAGIAGGAALLFYLTRRKR